MAYSSIVKPSVYFNTKLFTGNGTDNHAITGVGFKPDWIWAKNRDNTDAHHTANVLNGAGYRFRTNTDGALGTQADGVKSFDSDGFTLGTTGSINGNGNGIVSWNWKAGSSNTVVSASGSGNNAYNACTHRANTTSGFSIVKYTGRNSDISNGDNTRVTHGLGVKPDFIITKALNVNNWIVQGKNYNDANLHLNTTDQLSGAEYVGDNRHASIGDTYFNVGNDNMVNQNGVEYISYVFIERTGFSRFGSYTGNGNADGTFVYTGFKPAWVMVKLSSAANENWAVFDNKRNTFNTTTVQRIRANDTQADSTSNSEVALLSNGFKVHDSDAEINGSGNTYIFMAFAENPLVANSGTDGVPATAR